MLALLLAAAAAAAARIMSGRRCAGGGAACAGAAAEAMEPAARELFEACRNGDVERVKRLVTPEKVNSRDTAGRKSTPLHFAAGNPGVAAPLRRAPNPTCAPGSRAPLPGLSPRGLRAGASRSPPGGYLRLGQGLEGACRAHLPGRCVCVLWLGFVSTVLASTSGLAPPEGPSCTQERGGRGRDLVI